MCLRHSCVSFCQAGLVADFIDEDLTGDNRAFCALSAFAETAVNQCLVEAKHRGK